MKITKTGKRWYLFILYHVTFYVSAIWIGASLQMALDGGIPWYGPVGFIIVGLSFTTASLWVMKRHNLLNPFVHGIIQQIKRERRLHPDWNRK